MLYSLMWICLVLATVMFALWLFLYIKFKKPYAGILDGVDPKIFTLKQIYFLGLGCIEIYEQAKGKKITASVKAVEKMKGLAEVFGKHNAELYYYVSTAATISLILTFIPLGLMMICFLQSYIGLLTGILLAYAMIYGVNSSINAAIKNKKEDILSEFPKMVSKLTLLVNAGMLVRRAWDEVANSNFEHTLYEEMRTTSKDILEGMSIEDAMSGFATRCGIKEMRKFSSIYVQAINRGASESVDSMKIMADEAWEQKKQISRQKGEIAAQKLLVPNLIMFAGIMAIVIIPMVTSMMGGI